MAITLSCDREPSYSIGAATGTATHISCRSAEIAGKAILSGISSDDLNFGVLYSTSSNVIIGSSTQIEARSSDSECNYSVNTDVLEPETKYYYRSYVSMSGEIVYGDIKSFKTLAVSSMIQTLDVTEINTMDAVLNATLDLTDCKYDEFEYGFEVTPDGETPHIIKSDNHSEKRFSAKDESLLFSTKYSVVAYVKLDGRRYNGTSKNFTTDCPTPELVDLGLSVKWSSFNLGAASPRGYGCYYQWAGIEDVSSINLYIDNCPYHAGEDWGAGWTKYIPSNQSFLWFASGDSDNKIVLDPDDDVAHMTLGGKWRMPTIAEYNELIDNCTSEWITMDEVGGLKFTSKKNGNSIFFPAAGYRDNDSLILPGSLGAFWTSSLSTEWGICAYSLLFSSKYVDTGYYRRYYGESVRPVSK